MCHPRHRGQRSLTQPASQMQLISFLGIIAIVISSIQILHPPCTASRVRRTRRHVGERMGGLLELAHELSFYGASWGRPCQLWCLPEQ